MRVVLWTSGIGIMAWVEIGLVLLIALPLAYLLGAYSYAQRLWPIAGLQKVKSWVSRTPAVPTDMYKFDRFGRLTDYPDKKEISCPPQTEKTLVLLTIGQSNAANSGGQRYRSLHGDKVLNYFHGKCFVASSPLLGTNGISGESWTLLGNKLISSGIAERVILIPSAIGSTTISRWKKGGDLNGMLQSVLSGLNNQYRITDIIWHQGEDDFLIGTSREAYSLMFLSMVQTIRAHGVDAPIFVSIATKCGMNPSWHPHNPVSDAQRSLHDEKQRICQGVDTDLLLNAEDRFEGCHFAGSGQEKFAAAWLDILRRVYSQPHRKP
jgi:hypothetical protein